MQREGSKSRTLLCLAALLAVSACTNMGFERGGSARGFAEARSQCKAVPADNYKSCMRKAGWFTGGPSAESPAKTAAASPAPKPTPAAKETAQTQPPDKPAVEKADAGSSATSVATPPPHGPAPHEQTDAMVAAGSWWKIGGSAAALTQALKACGATPADHMVSRATLACMQAKGWYAQGS